MAWSLDARIPVFIGSLDAIQDGDAMLVEGEAPLQGSAAERFDLGEHAIGCACCLARSPAAIALDRLFQRRVRGETAFFKRVLAIPATVEGVLAVHVALRDDPVASARYRLAGTVGTS